MTGPLVQDETLALARSMPEGTFGAAYAHFMDQRKFTAGERPPVSCALILGALPGHGCCKWWLLPSLSISWSSLLQREWMVQSMAHLTN